MSWPNGGHLKEATIRRRNDAPYPDWDQGNDIKLICSPRGGNVVSAYSFSELKVGRGQNWCPRLDEDDNLSLTI